MWNQEWEISNMLCKIRKLPLIQNLLYFQMTTIASLIPSYIPPKPTAKDIEEASPIRTKARSTIMSRYDLFTKELPLFNDAGMTIYQIKPLKTFLEAEVAWWNANVELNTQQVNTRRQTYLEKLETISKDFQIQLDTAISLLPIEKSKPIVNKLAEIESAKSTKDSEAFEDVKEMPDKLIDIDKLQKNIKDSEDKKIQLDNEKLKKDLDRTVYEDAHDAFKNALAWAGRILYICIALRVASFAANGIFYKPLQYRILIFIYAFIFAPLLLPYYIYREIVTLIWPSTELPLFLSFFPVTPYEANSPMTFQHRMFGYPDIPEVPAWSEKNRQAEFQATENFIKGSTVLQELVKAKEAAQMGR